MDLQQAFATFSAPPREFGPIPFWFLNDDLEEEELLRQLHAFHECPLRRLRAARAGRSFTSRRVSHRRVLPPGAAAGRGSRPARHEGHPVRRGQLPVGIGAGSGGRREPGLHQPGDGSVAAHGGGSVRGILAPQHGPRAAGPPRLHRGRPPWAGRRHRSHICARAGRTAARHREYRRAGRPLDGHEHMEHGQRRPHPRRLSRRGETAASAHRPPATSSTRTRWPASCASPTSATTEHLKEFFGSTIIAMFTDEPQLMGRYPLRPAEPEAVHARADRLAGASAGARIPAPGCRHCGSTTVPTPGDFRRKFHAAIQERLEEVFFAAQSRWCADHGIALTGHPAESGELSPLRYFQLPGQDMV